MCCLIMQKFLKSPFELFRIQTSVNVKLRENAAQMKLGQTTYDLKLDENGIVAACKGIFFEGPNGMSISILHSWIGIMLERWDESFLVLYRGLLKKMPPKGAPSKKTELKEKKKIVEDKTFGLKNKNKSAKVNKFVQQVEKTVFQGNKKATVKTLLTFRKKKRI